MKTLELMRQILASEKDYLTRMFNVSEIGIFGSYVRGEQTERSDVDILVDFSGNTSLFDVVDLEDYLTQKLDVRVDLVLKKALKPRIGEKILKEVVYL